MKPEKICQNCKYYEEGFCKKYPPKQYYVKDYDNNTWKFKTSFPYVCKSNWCGEWKKKKG